MKHSIVLSIAFLLAAPALLPQPVMASEAAKGHTRLLQADTLLIDDFEDQDTLNAIGGGWQITGGLTGSLAYGIVAGGYNSDYAIHVSGNYTNWPGIETTTKSDGTPLDLSEYQGIQFAVKATILDTLSIRVREQKRVDDATYEFADYHFMPGSDWTIVTVPFSALVSSYTEGPLNPPFDATDITYIDFEPYVTGVDGDFTIDDVRLLKTITAVEPRVIAAPASYGLSRNFPNPFNPSTMVEFTLGNAGYASLRVYDVLGREVAVLAEGELAAGSHSVRFDGSGLSSGTYLAVLQSGGHALFQKMMLVK